MKRASTKRTLTQSPLVSLLREAGVPEHLLIENEATTLVQFPSIFLSDADLEANRGDRFATELVRLGQQGKLTMSPMPGGGSFHEPLWRCTTCHPLSRAER